MLLALDLDRQLAAGGEAQLQVRALLAGDLYLAIHRNVKGTQTVRQVGAKGVPARPFDLRIRRPTMAVEVPEVVPAIHRAGAIPGLKVGEKVDQECPKIGHRRRRTAADGGRRRAGWVGQRRHSEARSSASLAFHSKPSIASSK
ncbi:hypothetical protein [Caenispirillum salinarum]|uniref:hypothetical protein n=1 Tax=Caenispirillum salinarum TaxID=859058 RepID=UPI001266F92E|nr:hypothetical protein [Caenispirillum salinarum]